MEMVILKKPKFDNEDVILKTEISNLCNLNGEESYNEIQVKKNNTKIINANFQSIKTDDFELNFKKTKLILEANKNISLNIKKFDFMKFFEINTTNFKHIENLNISGINVDDIIINANKKIESITIENLTLSNCDSMYLSANDHIKLNLINFVCNNIIIDKLKIIDHLDLGRFQEDKEYLKKLKTEKVI